VLRDVTTAMGFAGQVLLYLFYYYTRIIPIILLLYPLYILTLLINHYTYYIQTSLYYTTHTHLPLTPTPPDYKTTIRQIRQDIFFTETLFANASWFRDQGVALYNEVGIMLYILYYYII
jgi:hypothetical protein